MTGASIPGSAPPTATQAVPAGAASNPAVTGLAGAPASAVSAPASARPRPMSGVRARVSRATRSDTAPAHLRRLGALGLLAGVLTGATSFAATSSADDALVHASAAGTAATRLTQAAHDVTAARADSAAAVLDRETPASSGGAYARATADLTRAANAVTGAAAARGADGPDLTGASGSLHTYAGQVAAAAAGQNASGLTAADRAAAEVGSTLTAAATSDSEVVGAASTIATTGRVLTGLVGVASTVGLLGACYWLARKTHRIVNVPLAAGTVLVAGVTIAALATSGAAATALADTHSSVVTDESGLSPRATVLNARLAEVTALRPGSGTQLDATTWTQQKTELDNDLLADASTSSAWKAYRDSRDKTATLAANDRTAAATQATTVGQPAFAKLDTALLARESRDVAAARPVSPALPWLLLVGGVLGGIGALLAAAGRLKEYR